MIMIGTDSGVYALKCDECGRELPCVFGSVKAVENHMSDNGWQKITDGKGVLTHICPACTEETEQSENGENNE